MTDGRADDAMDKANEAMVLATEAVTMITSHEKTCTERYGIIVKLLLFLIAVMLGDIGLAVWPAG